MLKTQDPQGRQLPGQCNNAEDFADHDHQPQRADTKPDQTRSCLPGQCDRPKSDRPRCGPRSASGEGLGKVACGLPLRRVNLCARDGASQHPPQLRHRCGKAPQQPTRTPSCRSCNRASSESSQLSGGPVNLARRTSGATGRSFVVPWRHTICIRSPSRHVAPNRYRPGRRRAIKPPKLQFLRKMHLSSSKLPCAPA